MPTLNHRFVSPASTEGWDAINDGVMGGVSSSRLRFDLGGRAVYEDEVSLENNGGFASVWTPLPEFGCAVTVAYRLTVWGDDHTYKLNFRIDSGFDGVNYQATFSPSPGSWTQAVLPLAAFGPIFRGRLVNGVPPLQPQLVKQVGLTISDKQAGVFRLLLQSIAAVSCL